MASLPSHLETLLCGSKHQIHHHNPAHITMPMDACSSYIRNGNSLKSENPGLNVTLLEHKIQSSSSMTLVKVQPFCFKFQNERDLLECHQGRGFFAWISEQSSWGITVALHTCLIGLLLSLLLVPWQEEFALHACLISCFSHNFLFPGRRIFHLVIPPFTATNTEQERKGESKAFTLPRSKEKQKLPHKLRFQSHDNKQKISR
jgi:hypothetical protein